jgi:hypothetical protein
MQDKIFIPKGALKKQQPDNVVASNLIELRDSLQHRAFYENGTCKNTDIAEIVFKINSCLYLQNPRF